MSIEFFFNRNARKSNYFFPTLFKGAVDDRVTGIVDIDRVTSTDIFLLQLNPTKLIHKQRFL